MRRPDVSVVMPFGAGVPQAASAVSALLSLDVRGGDELILADNSGGLGTAPATGNARRGADSPPIVVVPAPGERSPARARNAGASRATNDWILFLDADCRPLGRLLEDYFSADVADDVGAVAGQVLPAPGSGSLTARYGAARNFLDQQAHFSHPYLPRAAAANLLVRRAAFEQVGGFYEGVRAAEDTDFSWRLQRRGWRLELRPQARVEHRYRGTLRELRRQWRGYAAGRAWLARRYEGFEPEPAVARALGRTGIRRRRGSGRRMAAGEDRRKAGSRRSLSGGAPFRAIDAVLALEELAGFALSNRPSHSGPDRDQHAELVLVTDRFPGQGDPLVELASALQYARVEAIARPDVPDLDASRRLAIRYLEDEGTARRTVAGIALAVHHPLRAARDVLHRGSGDPSTWALAPAVQRLEHTPAVRLHALGGRTAQATAHRLARLAGRPLES